MSYILDALKKAQAERQLGELPSIHAAHLQTGGDQGRGNRLGRTVWLALGVMAVALLILSYMMWRMSSASPAARLATLAPATGTVVVAPLSAGVALPEAAVAPTTAKELASALAEAKAEARAELKAEAKAKAEAEAKRSAKAAASNAASARNVAKITGAEASAEGTPRKPRNETGEADAAPTSTPAAAAKSASARASAAAAAEDEVLWVNELPEPIQVQIPTLAMGGYMYSKNPADRMVLIDKVLRHEGQEVAPGVILEKLQAKSAVFSFKGYRYRVKY